MKKFILFFITGLLLTIKVSTAQTEITFYTNMGTFVAKMYDTLQPITAGNFISLVNAKFYDGIIFHRVINNFMIQGGDPTGTGYGGPGYTIPDEFHPLASNVQKAIAMANAGPNTGGSQFFINLVNNLYLNPNYPVFGIVISNFSVVQAIGAVPVNGNDRPLTDVVMDSLRVTYAFHVGTNDLNDKNLNINIFPNPADDIISIDLGNSLSGKNGNVITISDLPGRIISTIPLNQRLTRLDLKAMNLSGIYIARIADAQNNTVDTRKILIR